MNICVKKKIEDMPKDNITSIVFRQSSNIFINNGILGLYTFLKKYQLRFDDLYPSLEFSLSKKELKIDCTNLLSLLEEVYYFMGRSIYDTATKKQKEENYNVYYDTKKDSFKRFPKMNTYGLTHLLTNNAQGVTRNKKNAPKIAQLRKVEPALASKIEGFFTSNGIKLLSKVYLDEPYTKITRLDIHEKYFLEGDNVCPLTGESFKYLLPATNVSPFISGMVNFNSFQGDTDKYISWKALYLIRFSPATCFYTYQNNYETIICSFFNSDNLKNIQSIFDPQMIRPIEELQEINFSNNFKLANWKIQKKDAETFTIETNKDAVWESEINFMLLYTFYKNKFAREISKEVLETDNVSDPFADSPLEKIPISLVSFRADKFAATMRPSFHEEYNNVKYVIRFLYTIEKKYEIPFSSIWTGLKINSPKAKVVKKQDYNRGQAVERQIRQKVLGKVLTGKSILDDIEELFYKSFSYLINREKIGYRNYSHLLKFLLIHQKSLNMNQKISEELQEKSIDLGRQIGNKISALGEGTEIDKVKKSRKYTIRLRKARTLEQFTDILADLMNRYSIGFISDSKFLKKINEKNYYLVKQYLLISMLNTLNSKL